LKFITTLAICFSISVCLCTVSAVKR
jgi:hypothetical protein